MKGNPSTSPSKGIPETSSSRAENSVLEIRVNPSSCPHIRVNILGTEIIALLDSGAGFSVMSALNVVKSHGFKILKCNVKICTADDTEHTCLGYVNVPYTLGTETRVVPTLIVPEIRKPLILGMNFWKAFQIRPMITSKNSIEELELTWTSDINEKSVINYLRVEELTTEADPINLSIHLLESTDEEPQILLSQPEQDETLDIPTLELPKNPQEAIDNIETEHELTPEQRAQLQEVLKGFDCTSQGRLGKTTLIEHEIEVIEGIKIRDMPMYRYSPQIWEKIEKELERWQELDVIEECVTEFANPLVPVKKANGKIRVCLDSRRINQITKKDAYPMRNMAEIFHRLQKAKYFSVVDLKDAYFQVPL